MPRDLFGDASFHTRSTRSRRSSVVLFSVLGHAAALCALLIAPLVATDALPRLRQPIDDFVPPGIMPVVVPAPHPPRVTASRPDQPFVTAAPPSPPAPIVEPNGFADETGLEVNAGRPGSTGIPDIGVIVGIGSNDIERVDPLPPPARAAPVRAADLIRPPRKLIDVSPVYPQVAREARVEGVVIIEAIIATDGRIDAARVIKGVPLLDQAALDAVKRWRFSPTLINGRPVPVIMTVTVYFTLQ